MGLGKRYTVQAWWTIPLVLLGGLLAMMGVVHIMTYLIGIALGTVFWPWFFWNLAGRPHDEEE
jgi:hypothetical protein